MKNYMENNENNNYKEKNQGVFIREDNKNYEGKCEN